MGSPEDRRSTHLPDPYFHPDHLPEARLQYVAWLDLMGTTSMMEHSVEVAATNVCKLHLLVAQQEAADRLGVYPMNDGVYVVSDSYRPLRDLLAGVLSDYARVVTSDANRESWDPTRLAVFRAAVAYGPLYHPEDAMQSALADYRYASSILLGEPMTVAYRRESDAPPFGIVADESVHEADGEVRWWKDDDLARLLFLLFEEYVRACSAVPEMTYPAGARRTHLENAREYLVG